MQEVVHDTFNAITVDGECSTNDCVMLLANGAGDVVVDDATYSQFVDVLRAVCLPLALGIVRGGEGASKLITVAVSGGFAAFTTFVLLSARTVRGRAVMLPGSDGCVSV